MLDPDELAAFEAWKLAKLAGQVDLTVASFNAEMGALARAYDEGIDAMENSRESASSLKARSPYRRPGMRGHAPHAAQLPSTATTDQTE